MQAPSNERQLFDARRNRSAEYPRLACRRPPSQDAGRLPRLKVPNPSHYRLLAFWGLSWCRLESEVGRHQPTFAGSGLAAAGAGRHP